jgi:hypothetical protein
MEASPRKMAAKAARAASAWRLVDEAGCIRHSPQVRKTALSGIEGVRATFDYSERLCKTERIKDRAPPGAPNVNGK